MISDANTGRLHGKVVIVTGAGGSLGSASAQLFAAQGASVVCADLDLDAAQKTADTIREHGGAAVPLAVDVTSATDCERMADLALSQFGRIDGLFANAGINSGKAVHEVSPEEWRRVMDINTNGVFLACRAVLPAMMAQGSGSIVIQASICATNGIKQTAAYSASKGAVLGLGYQMAVDYAPHGIRVNCTSPGTIRTPLVEDLYVKRAALRGTTAEADLARTAASYPMNRLGQPAEVAAAALYLLSDEASFTTGINLPVDGGFSAA